MDWDINVLLSQDENLGYWLSTGFGFKSLRSFIFEWCYFRKNGLTENFCHRKGSWKPPKTTQLCWLAVTKPLDQNLIMRYQRKEDIHIFYLIPCDAKYLYYSGHTDHFYNQGPNGKWKNGEWYVHIVRGPWPVLLSNVFLNQHDKIILTVTDPYWQNIWVLGFSSLQPSLGFDRKPENIIKVLRYVN